MPQGPISSAATPSRPRGGCPTCGKPRVQAFRPFCSRGCRDRDLIGWFDEAYAIPVTTPPEPGEIADDGGHERED